MRKKVKMKKIIIGMSFLALVSCGPASLLGGGSGSSSSSGGSLGIKLNPIKINPIKISHSRTDTFEGDYTTNKISKLNIFSCVAKAMSVDLITQILDGVIEDITKREFDLIIPEHLSKKVFDDLRDKSREAKIDPAEFWDRLDSDIAMELNEFLIYKNLKSSDSKYKNLKQKVALGLTLLVESGDFSKGLKLNMKAKSGKRRISIAFSEDAHGKVNTPICDSYDINKIETAENQLKPSDITTYMTCEKKDMSLVLEGRYGTDLTLSINDGESEEVISMKTEEVEITSENDKKVVYQYESADVSSLKLSVTRRGLDSDNYKGTLKIKSESISTKMRRLKCTSVK
jgi:hypothetical protein